MTWHHKLKKTEWPAHITDALGIPAIMGKGGPWHSTGDTTDLAWFHALCDYLGIDYPGERIRAMEAIITAAGGVWNEGRHRLEGHREDSGRQRAP
ncbi:hypothetical protein G5V59_12100 [Nocardioides sp. W3-2-3]|uniref:hypothetical protein n=1 Tax=Nocardioides convexus TaxID=2712224 RepID=UPI00241816A3|nr:hypothetical protein [Nocardioides convexus]NHA00517.1 hypothetical protein [Nocardioides convexus]